MLVIYQSYISVLFLMVFDYFAVIEFIDGIAVRENNVVLLALFKEGSCTLECLKPALI